MVVLLDLYGTYMVKFLKILILLGISPENFEVDISTQILKFRINKNVVSIKKVSS